jgi:hypothetical protein
MVSRAGFAIRQILLMTPQGYKLHYISSQPGDRPPDAYICYGRER